jgi:hypothetical protein
VPDAVGQRLLQRFAGFDASTDDIESAARELEDEEVRVIRGIVNDQDLQSLSHGDISVGGGDSFSTSQ